MTAPAFIPSTIAAVIRQGAGLSGISAVVIAMSTDFSVSWSNSCSLR
jgi:hypothetical protein